LRTIKPLDYETLAGSIRKTGRAIVVDAAWRNCGLAAEIVAWISENLFDCLFSPPIRITLPDVPAPASASLERVYYPTYQSIVERIRTLMLNRAERRIASGI